MKRAFLFLALTLLAAAPALQAEETSYGEGLTIRQSIPLSMLLANPDRYIGQKVRVEGTVTEVCQMKGCWMEIEESPKAKIRIKVDDGVIVFPPSAKGKPAIAEGVLEAIPMTRDSYVAWCQHEAEERGQAFDAATVGDGPFQILQLRGTGARILDK